MEDKKRILILSEQAAQINDTLRSHGYDGIVAANSAQAIEHFLNKDCRLILLDSETPGIKDFENAYREKAGSMTNIAPVIFLFSKQNLPSPNKIGTEFEDFLVKPFDSDELVMRIEKVFSPMSSYDDLKKSHEELKEQEGARKKLIKIIVHDLNNPLVAVSGGIQLVQMEGEERLKEGQRRNINIALLACKDMGRIIANLVDIDKMEEGVLTLKSESFMLAHIIQEVISEVKAIADYDQKTLSLEIAKNMPPVLADRQMIKHTVTNLINSALKDTPPNEEIKINISYNEEEGDFLVQIKDAGRGLPPEYLEKVFDKFIQVETAGEVKRNQGLGLTFCKGVVELHKGRIWAENGRDKGCCFTFTLPVGQGAKKS